MTLLDDLSVLDRPGADDGLYDRFARMQRVYVCGAVRERGVMRDPWVCTRDEHADPWHQDDNADRRRAAWCDECQCETQDHQTIATLLASEPEEWLDEAGDFYSCGSCGTCKAVCA